jgi:hypothetical protein
MTTDNTPATLATAKHGGCVQLKDWQHVLVLREMRAQFTDAGSPARTAALDAAIAALSAQPSPGGQSAPEIEQLRALVSSILSTVSLGHQKGPYAYAGEDFGRYLAEAARDCRTILRALSDLAARQPVGNEPAFYLSAGAWGHIRVPMTPTRDVKAFRHGFDHGDTELVPFYAAPPAQQPAQAVDLAADHCGMRVDYHGLLRQVQDGLRHNPALAEMVRQLHGHLTELGKRWYAGDRMVVDELLQLYGIEDGARRALTDSQAVGNG